MFGFYGKALVIDLTRREASEIKITEDVYKNYLGGKGLGTYLLTKLNPEGVDPLAPQNNIIFAIGPITDTLIYGSSRYGVFTKSPLTGIYLESYAGGDVAEYISRTGYDAIAISGASPTPIFLEITPQAVSFHDASSLWGKDAYQTEDSLREKFPQAGIAVIGPAGENLVRLALIENNYWRSCGRGGAGAVLGSKKVKGLVFHGNRKRQVADPALLKDFSVKIGREFYNGPTATSYRKWGTPMVVAQTNSVGAFPAKYWSRGTVENWQKISAEALLEQCEVKSKACPKCFIACGKRSRIKKGRHAGLILEGPEYETIDSFGGICMVDDIREIIYLNDICDRLGIDTISSGNLCGFAIEASHRKDLGFKIEYGDVDQIAQLLFEMARKEGVGAILAEGIKFAAGEWGLEDLAVHTKGMDPPGYEPRVLKGMGLAYATSDRGACHLRATFYKPELSGMIPPEQIEGKAQMFIQWEDRMTIQDTLILCRFFRDIYLWDEFSTMIKASTGMELDMDSLRKIAVNVCNLARNFNSREGLSLEDDTLPLRLTREPLKDSGKIIIREEITRLVEDYHRLRGFQS